MKIHDTVCLPVVGLAFADYDRVRAEIGEGSQLRLVPVDDNPYDANAVEVWFDASSGPVRVGFVPRADAEAARRAIADRSEDGSVTVMSAGCGLAFALDISTFETARALTHQPEPEQHADAADDAMSGYRAFLPGEAVDPNAPKDEEDLLSSLAKKLCEATPGLSEWDAIDEAREALKKVALLVRDASAEVASPHPKLGGMPYAETGWSWPTCPSCGCETVFVAQMRDPMSPEDLIQVFECTDPDMELCHQWAQEDPKRYSLVRVWRSPDASALVPIAPSDPGLALPAYRLMEDVVPGDGDSGITQGGVAYALNCQSLADEGWHAVARIWLPKCAGNLLHSHLVVARHGRGRVVAFDDHG